MRSMLLRCLTVTLTVSMLSGCAFTQWTDHAFIGSPDDPPTHANREWAGAVVLPLAFVGDIVTAPVQLIVLLVRGDHGIYARSNMRSQRVSLIDADGVAVAAASADAAEKLSQVVAAAQGDTPQLSAWTVDADGGIAEYALTPQQQALLLARAGSSVAAN